MNSTTEKTPTKWQQLSYRGPSIDVLFEDYARKRRTDVDAPITATHDVLINAPVDRVWQVLSQPDRWETVDPGIRDVRLDGGVVEGARFKWRNGSARLSSRFAVVDRNRELTWTGTTMGAKVVHRHILTATDDGRTRLVTEESMTGTLLVLLFSRAKLHAALEKWLSAIAAAAESASV